MCQSSVSETLHQQRPRHLGELIRQTCSEMISFQGDELKVERESMNKMGDVMAKNVESDTRGGEQEVALLSS